MQAHGRACFELKTSARSLLLHKLRMQNFDRYRAVHQQMARTIHGPHSAFAEPFFEMVLFVESLICEWIVILQSITAGGADTLRHHQVDLAILLHRGL